jgi:acyl carrier protein
LRRYSASPAKLWRTCGAPLAHPANHTLHRIDASVKRIPADTIKLDTNLQDLGIDSLDVFTLLFELENAFKISIPDDDVRSLRTVNDIVDGIKKILAAAPPDTSLGSATPAD